MRGSSGFSLDIQSIKLHKLPVKMSWKKSISTSGFLGKFQGNTVKVLLGFKSMRMNEITKEIRVTGERRGTVLSLSGHSTIKVKQMERSQQQSLVVALWLVRMKTTGREWCPRNPVKKALQKERRK